jgi:hypothetical protein
LRGTSVRLDNDGQGRNFAADALAGAAFAGVSFSDLGIERHRTGNGRTTALGEVGQILDDVLGLANGAQRRDRRLRSAFAYQ